MEHAGKACKAPMEICMTFNNVAASLIDHKIAREIDADEGLDLLQSASEKNLVQLGDNVKEQVSFICNCCGCCCEALVAAKNFGFLNPVQTTNFIPKINVAECNGCGRCVNVCPIDALELVPVINESDRVRKAACLGCGLCVKSCNFNAMMLVHKKNRVITPVNSVHRVVMMAIERGKLQNLIFDKQALWNHRAMAAILGVILKLPPVKRALASEQFKSKYLEFMIRKFQIN
jgi:ferredoxin